MTVRKIDGVRVRSRHHQHFDGRASVTLSWQQPSHKVTLELHFPGGKTEAVFQQELDSAAYDELLRNTICALEEATRE